MKNVGINSCFDIKIIKITFVTGYVTLEYVTMVNTEDFIKRLEMLLDYYSVSASAFADTIGVQRSGLSHLLSGRNKPSLDFILKIVENYPEVDLYWLLNGKGSFPKDKASDTKPATPAPAPKESGPIDLFTAKDDTDVKKPIVEPVAGPQEIKVENSSIERIVVFYKDGTFKNFNPQE